MSSNNDTHETTNGVSISRRDLLRRGAAATTAVGLVGGASTQVPDRYQPVGRAEAIAGTTLVVGGIAAAGLVGLGFYAGSRWGSDGLEADEVTDATQAVSLYNSVESTMLATQSSIDIMGDRLGVDTTAAIDMASGGSLADAHVEPQDNPHAHTLTEHATGSAARMWSEGASLGEMQAEARRQVRLASIDTEFSVLSIWNDTIAALSSQITAEINASHGVITVDPAEMTSGGFSLLAASSQDHTPVAADRLDDGVGSTYDGSGWSGPMAIGSRDIGPHLPVSVDSIPTEQRPDTGYVAFEIFFNGGANEIISPYANVSAAPANTPLTTDMSSGSPADRDLEPVSLTATNPDLDQTTTLELWRYNTIMHAVYAIRQSVISEIDPMVESIYNGLESGQIDVTDVLSGRQLYQQFDPDDNTSRAQIELASYGNLDSEATTATISVPSGEHTGVLFIDAQSEVAGLQPGDTISASAHDGAYLVPQDGTDTVTIDGSTDIEIVDVSDGELSYSPRQRLGPQGITADEVQSIVKGNQERYQELEKQIEEMQQDDGLLGLGGLGGGLSGGDGLLLLGGTGLAAYLLGR